MPSGSTAGQQGQHRAPATPSRHLKKYKQTQQEHRGSCYPRKHIFTHTHGVTQISGTTQRWYWLGSGVGYHLEEEKENKQHQNQPHGKKEESIVCRLQRAKGIYKRLLQLFSGHLQIRTKSKCMPKKPNMNKKGKNAGIIADPPGLSGVPWHFGWPSNMIALLCILKTITTKVKGGGSRGGKEDFSEYILIWK